MHSQSGTHLGHNLPDAAGNRYCIDLVSVSGWGTPPPPDRDSGLADGDLLWIFVGGALALGLLLLVQYACCYAAARAEHRPAPTRRRGRVRRR